MSPRAPGLLVAVVTSLAACGTGDDGSGPRDAAIEPDGGRDCTAVIGDRALPIEVRPVYLDEAGGAHPLVADGPVTLIPPLQGGFVLMVGLEAKNVRGCAVTIAGALTEPTTGAVIGGESRPSQLVVGADGWGALAFPANATSANVATCPGTMLPRDVDGNPWRLTLTLTEDSGRSAMWSGLVVPRCDPAGRDPVGCACQCDSQFQFGQPCPVD